MKRSTILVSLMIGHSSFMMTCGPVGLPFFQSCKLSFPSSLISRIPGVCLAAKRFKNEPSYSSSNHVHPQLHTSQGPVLAHDLASDHLSFCSLAVTKETLLLAPCCQHPESSQDTPFGSCTAMFDPIILLSLVSFSRVKALIYMEEK